MPGISPLNIIDDDGDESRETKETSELSVAVLREVNYIWTDHER